MDGAEAEWTVHGRAATMSSTVPVLSVLICAALSFLASADASTITARLPHQILMNTSISVASPPIRMDVLSVRWDHNERPLLEYIQGNLTFHHPWAKMAVEQLPQGNISLVLTNLNMNNTGNYTCVVRYDGVMQTAIYSLIIERNRIRILNLTPPPEKSRITVVRSTKTTSAVEHVAVKLGENATLHCNFSTDAVTELSTLVVHWSKDGETKYFSNKSCCDFPGYDISEQDLQQGRAPLQLVHVQEKDAGMYTCAIKYKAMEESWNIRFRIQDGSRRRHLGLQTATAVRTLETNDRVVPESGQQYRTVKLSLVAGALVLTGILAAFLYFCYKG